MRQPRIYAQQLFDEYAATKVSNPVPNWTSPIRRYNTVPPIFTQGDPTYDAYQRDIAEVRVFHSLSTVFWYQVNKRKT